MDRRMFAAILVAAASIGVQVLIPMVWPELDRRVGLALLAVCVLGLVAAALTFPWARHIAPSELHRRWQIVGMGQGWIEARVRNNIGDELMVAWNAGAGNDRISVWVTFSSRRAPRTTANVELVFDIDGTTFEWDVPDYGGKQFTIAGETWRTVEALKQMLAAIREGDKLVVSAPKLGLSGGFTLMEAFDVLEDTLALAMPSAASAPVK